MKKIIALFLATVMVISFCACGKKEAVSEPDQTSSEAPETTALMDAPMTFKVTTTQSSGSLWVKHMTSAYEEITERTNGELKFEIYPDGELGKNNDVVEQILAGAPIILGCGFDTMSDYSEKLAIASCPYVFQDMSEVFSLADTDWYKTAVAELAESSNIQIFAQGTLGFRHFIGSEPITCPEDMKPLIVRMGSDLMRNWITVMGSTPASGAWADNYSNIQQGVFHACEATLDLLWSSSLYEVCDYLTLSGHSINPNISIMTANNWNKIPAKYQAVITEVMAKTMSAIYDETVASEAKIVADFQDKGVEICEVDKAAFAAFTPDLLEMQGYDTEILNEINAALGR
ncbi:TRAP transporter substrate-binding protein DctP [Anaerotruncus rubiinfantis]|uniref:TRAP transporter substrate-binding protein DctP n=1 Tax=Anaerotruncus rubiinfantis TaxID=1720200 RepID=UPI00189950DC|nr:TRAP transporter substrate-binding protein DctP [Anaerotruncus rubiinfantis]